MKQGRTLPELVTEVERQRSAKKDALVYSNSLVMASNGTSRLALPEDAGAFQLQPTAHRQLGQHLSIPSAFYDAMQAHVEDWLDPEGRPLFDTTVNSLLRARPADEKRLVRTLDGNARAFLSAKYRAMDNLPILASVLPVLQEEQGIDWQGASMEVTDSRLYLKLVNQRVQGEVKVGDIVQAGVLITNSEVGLGAFRVQPLMFRLVCSNGLVTPDQSAGRMARHVGGVLGGNGSDEAFEWLADDTLAARSDATIKEMRDVIRASLSEAFFSKALDTARGAAATRINGDPSKAVEWVQDKYGLTDEERGGVMRNLIEGADLSLWGLVNSITAMAQTVDSYDRSTELEVAGDKLLALPAPDLKALVDRNN